MKDTWNIPDQYHEAYAEDLEELKNSKPCPKCGTKIYVQTPWGGADPAWDGVRCMACNYEAVIEL